MHWIRLIVLFGLAEFVAVLLGVSLHSRGLAMAITLPLVLAVGLAMPFLQVWGMRCRIVPSTRRGQVGRKLDVRLEFKNRALLPLSSVLVHGGWVPRGGALADECLVLHSVRQWGADRQTWSVVPKQRGWYPQQPPWLGTRFPFGFVEARRRFPVARQILIWPRTLSLTQAGIGVFDSGGLGSEWSSRNTGTSGEISGARPYRPGDSLRRVHWPQTARNDQLIVCERSSSSGQGMTLYLETDGEVHFIDREQSSLEFAIVAAASLLRAFEKQQRAFCIVAGREQIWKLKPPAAATPIMDGLALLDARDSAPLTGLLQIPGLARTTQLVITTSHGLARLDASEVRVPDRRFLVLHAADEPPAGRWGTAVTGLPLDDHAEQQFRRFTQGYLVG